MSVWQIVILSGQIGGVAGPLPYDMEECLRRANEMNAAVQVQVATGLDVHGKPLTEKAKTLRFECVEQPERPTMTYREDPAR